MQECWTWCYKRNAYCKKQSFNDEAQKYNFYYIDEPKSTLQRATALTRFQQANWYNKAFVLFYTFCYCTVKVVANSTPITACFLNRKWGAWDFPNNKSPMYRCQIV